MNCFPLFSYIFFIILYAILFSYMFNPKLENIIMIFLFVVTFIGGYNLFSDLSRREIFMEFKPISDAFEDGAGLDLLKLILFSPFSTVIVFTFLIIALFGYFTGHPTANVSYIIFLGVLLFITNMVQIGISMNDVRLSNVLILPILMTLISLVFVLIEIYNINTSTTGKQEPMPYSQLDQMSIYYKIAMILEILLLAGFIGYFVLFYTKGDKTMQYQLYTVLLMLYGISGGMVYITSQVFNKKFLGKIA